MKRLLSLLFTSLLLVTAVFADEPGDEYDDGYIYEQNGAGDQFLKFDFSGCLPITSANLESPLIHKGQVTPGFSFDLGYYRFLTAYLAVGGEVTFTSNWSIGEKLLTTIPVIGGVLFQPMLGSFEFPIYAGVGISYHSWANNKYFPGFAAKTTAGVYYRITESWSAGASGSIIWEPEWYSNAKYTNTSALFSTISIGGRFHF